MGNSVLSGTVLQEIADFHLDTHKAAAPQAKRTSLPSSLPARQRSSQKLRGEN